MLQLPAEVAAIGTELGDIRGLFTSKALYENLTLDLYGKTIGIVSNSPHLKDLMIKAPLLGELSPELTLNVLCISLCMK